MKKRPFGHRFYLTLLLSFGVAYLWQWLFRSMAHESVNNIVLAYVVSDLTYWLWGGGCTWYLGKILRAYVPKMIYRGFLVGAGALIIVIVYKAYGLYTLVTPEMHVRYVLVVNMVLPLLIAFAPAAYIYGRQILSEDIRFRRFNFGEGGSSIFAGVGTFRTMPAKLKQPLLSTPQTKDEGTTTDRIILGRTLPDVDPFPRILGSNSKAHWVLSGSTRSGKGVCYLLPLLMTALRDIIVFDPKGELAMNTLIRRSSPEWLRTHHGIEVSESEVNKHFKYGRTYVFDPFGRTPFRSSHYSIVSEIDPDSSDCGEYLTALMNGMVKPEAPKNKYFEEAPKSIIKAFIGHALTWFKKENKHNLPFAVDLLYGKDPETGFLDPGVFENILIEMLANDALGGLIQQGARELRDCGAEQRGNLMTAISRAVKWITDPPMRAHLSGSSEFSFKNIGNTHEIDEHGIRHKVTDTVYIVLPDTLMDSHDRWIRTLFSVATVALQKRVPLPKLSTTLLIDEFPKLSAMRTIVQGVSIFAGYKIQLLLVIQDLPQLKKAYPAEWNTFFANSNAIWFGVNDLETATHISNMAGKNLKIRTDSTPNIIDGKKIRNETATALLTPSEIMALLSRGSRYQIIFSNDHEYPLLLERLTFKPLQIIENGCWFHALPLDGLKGHYKEEQKNRVFQIIKTTTV